MLAVWHRGGSTLSFFQFGFFLLNFFIKIFFSYHFTHKFHRGAAPERGGMAVPTTVKEVAALERRLANETAGASHARRQHALS